MTQVAISGLGSYVPEKILTNFDLEKLVDTSNEWIIERTGILERRIASSLESSSSMGSLAAKDALETAKLVPEEIDLIITATCSPDGMFPSTANRIQALINAPNAVCFDINSACNGFLSSLMVGSTLIKSEHYKNALIIGSETLSRLIDWTDRNTCILFGDGAGAVVLEPTSEENYGLTDFLFGSDGNNADLLYATGPATGESDLQKEAKIIMDGQSVYRHAVSTMTSITKDLLIKTNTSISDIDLCIPHQANSRIINAVAKNLSLENDKVYTNVDQFGNTSAASIPIALTQAFYDKMLEKGNNLLFTAFGAGLNWGSVLLNWGTIKNPKEQ
ncbi:MAG: ketoacyl-ACP synthase III [Dehalococcoidia bacterium]|jgi:3-oxoacyl-[acyl-carrier-protein] synthase-3|nr:ketoacyl-ACP synthase III [Dehalococcoidia bacterium]